MKTGTIKIIFILVSTLFANIEAAHAGLIHKLKLFIHHEFSDSQLILFTTGLLSLSFLTYIIATPVSIGKEKLIWLTSFSYQKNSFNNRRKFISKTDKILNAKN